MNRGGKYLSLGFRAMNEQAGRTDLQYSNYSKRCLSLSLVKFNWRQTRQFYINQKTPRFVHLFNGKPHKSHVKNSKNVFNSVTEAVIKMTRLPFLLLTLALLQVESAPKHMKDFLEKEGILPAIFLAVFFLRLEVIF